MDSDNFANYSALGTSVTRLIEIRRLAAFKACGSGGGRGPLPTGAARGAQGGRAGPLPPEPAGFKGGGCIAYEDSVCYAAAPLGRQGYVVGLGLPVLTPFGGAGGALPPIQAGAGGMNGFGPLSSLLALLGFSFF